ncbi:polyketide synthase [Duganella sp. Leaf126]|uniref:beta-ketoacyl synthase N-terminal-like domain-containing protein n=1 Tax=Duganella sp. Leaf126 TaxID=1736266 RepID=UPI000AFFD0F6|nr:polyketide synthase [Duganella sp. Leaf126]
MSVLTDTPDDIAIIGMACRLPGAPDYEAFWRAQRDGRFCVDEVPADRWRWQQYYSPRREDENKTVSKWGGFMAGVDLFDAALFRISPREAELMDPQQRIMLELAWSCFEDAGYAPSGLRGSDMGVYLGVCNFDYKMQVERAPAAIEAHMSTGVHTTLIPNRISYEFDLRGPSIPFDTACSSSLVALAEAVHALRRGDCKSALVGGVSVLLNPTHFISFSKAGMLSPRGVCRSFDEGADGYVRGEGAGLIMLKPLQQALHDGDKVYGLVKGVAVNHGGKVATVTSPNPFAQARCVELALRDAGLSPAAIQYIEAHGTGTPKGDPIEMHALTRAYASQAKAHGVALPARSCAIGSVKTSIGHLEAAAGIAGIIKVREVTYTSPEMAVISA